MSSLLDEALKEKYRINGIHDPLAYMKDAIDWSVCCTTTMQTRAQDRTFP
ncbi:MAG: hypothetical protein M1515_03565 [Candidatus Thermoplasmatota archaeon]|nr:hypothetical protein [Candidatus Thermoplasmatota archaeon]